jgi:MinD-like ATPase involved in chromosome partitioning or flagellar assembly
MRAETFAALALADEAVFVTTPELPAVIDTLKLIKKCRELGTPVRGVILNRVRQHAHELFPGNVQALLGVPILATVPNDVSVSEALHVRHPVTYSHPDSPAARTIKEVAALLLS